MYSFSIQVLILVFLIYQTNACYLWGTDSGECVSDSLDLAWKTANIPFCAPRINFPICVPKYQKLPASREFPSGRWFNHTILKKDQWVQEQSTSFIQYRAKLERNKTLSRKNQNEYGDSGKITRRFYKKPDCQNAYRNLFCWLNFPRCDPTRDLTLPTCRSVCENFFIACGYERGLWRCGKSKYFNGYFPEAPIIGTDGNSTYLRDYFPGQPFRENRYTKGGSEMVICTPAVAGPSPKSNPINYIVYFILFLGLLFSFIV